MLLMFYSKIISSLSDYPLMKVWIGLNWTAVVVDKRGNQQCGLASTLTGEHTHYSEPAIPAPGLLETRSALELANWIESEIPLRRSIACAAINALLPRDTSSWVDQNAESAILEHGKGKNAVLIGHFPFVEKLKDQLGNLDVLDFNPTGDDLPAHAAPDILPQADLVAITGMTFINHTLPGLLALCKPAAYILILGPSTPLSPILFEFGVDLLAGAQVEKIPDVLAALSQGANFRQLHKAGVRLITQVAK
jgi:uncharacterized protein (DUF4213/DUF364 family)